MSATLTVLGCSQCGREAPSDMDELMQWTYGPVAVRGDYPEVIDSLLLCPDCIEEEHRRAFEEGGTG